MKGDGKILGLTRFSCAQRQNSPVQNKKQKKLSINYKITIADKPTEKPHAVLHLVE